MLTHPDPVKSLYEVGCERRFLAGDCLLAQPLEGPLSRKLSFKLDKSAAIADPFETLNFKEPFLNQYCF
jgi:hypothetical protein